MRGMLAAALDSMPLEWCYCTAGLQTIRQAFHSLAARLSAA